MWPGAGPVLPLLITYYWFSLALVTGKSQPFAVRHSYVAVIGTGTEHKVGCTPATGHVLAVLKLRAGYWGFPEVHSNPRTCA